METHLGPPHRDFNAGEFVLVISLAFGLAIIGSLAAALSYSNQPVEFGDAGLVGTLAFELVIGTVLWLILRAREWKWSDFSVHYSNGTTILGLLIGAITLIVWCVFEWLFGKVPSAVSGTMPLVLAVSVVNPLFEELLVLGYVVQSMRKRFGLVTAMNVSIAIRLLYHLYQGPLAVIPIALFGVLVTLVYVRMGRLWPAIVAHGAVDFTALAGFDC